MSSSALICVLSLVYDPSYKVIAHLFFFNMNIALIDIETLSPQYRLKTSDIITGIGIKSKEGNWIQIIKPSGERNTDKDEANLIYEAIQHLKEIKPDILTGCYLWGFDIPHLLARADELDYYYNRYTGKQLCLELVQILNRLRIIDLATTDYVLKELYPKYGKILKVEEICRELNIDTKKYPENFHVWASAKAISNESNHLYERLESDLNEEWKILQTLLSQNKIEL